MYSQEELDKIKTKILKYIIYKKRTEKEIRQKFADLPTDILEDIIEYLKEAGYINDKEYIKKSIQEYINLNNMSIKEISYKLQAKGIEKKDVEDFIIENRESLIEYEINSALRLIQKKQRMMEDEQIRNYLYKKGYMNETTNIAYENLKSIEGA